MICHMLPEVSSIKLLIIDYFPGRDSISNISKIINGTRQVTYFFGPTFYGQLLGISNQGLF